MKKYSSKDNPSFLQYYLPVYVPEMESPPLTVEATAFTEKNDGHDFGGYNQDVKEKESWRQETP
uniref:Uncharacterized protein n=1 Tax=Zea mays TaxID=4577 RepID=A0A804MT08_MAIZE